MTEEPRSLLYVKRRGQRSRKISHSLNSDTPDPKAENWEQSGALEEKNVMTGWAGKTSYEGIKKIALGLGLVETLHKETKRGLIHFTFREPKKTVEIIPLSDKQLDERFTV